MIVTCIVQQLVQYLFCDYFTLNKNISIYLWKVLSAQIRQFNLLLLLLISNNVAYQVALLIAVEITVTSLCTS